MANINKIKEVIKKIAGYNNLGEHIYFFGGSMPYIIANQDSNREHSDIDILVDSEFISIIREILIQSNLYEPELDSLNFNVDDDYGLKTHIDGVYVEFEPIKVESNFLHRKSFSPTKQIVGEEITHFDEITDLIIPVQLDGINTYSQSMEYIKVQKEKHKRDKDIKDIEFIDKFGIDTNKYERIKSNFRNAKEQLQNYSTLASPLNGSTIKPH